MAVCRIKICGITNVEDALLAAELGADAIGFIFAKSPRQVSIEIVETIVRELPPFVTPVGVFVNESPESIRHVGEQCGITTFQLHGDETPEMIESLDGFQIVKAIRVKDTSSLGNLERYNVNSFLFDSYSKTVRGGTGMTFQWKFLENATIPAPFILSGGLTPRNLLEAFQAVRPFGVDISSGVEAEPGRKDPHLLKELFKVYKQITDLE